MTDFYHKITRADCLSVATADEKARLDMITDYPLLHKLAMRWGDKHGYRVWGDAGGDCYDATSKDMKGNR